METPMKRSPIPRTIRRQVYDKYNGRCAYCGCRLDIKDMQVDHIDSVYVASYFRQEKVDDSIGNYIPACRACSYYKSADTIDGFRERIKYTLQHTCVNTFQAKLAIKYGIITVKPWNGKFYFENH